MVWLRMEWRRSYTMPVHAGLPREKRYRYPLHSTNEGCASYR
jgi:hypothetical protein